MIGIINYGYGNLASVQNALDFLGYENEICSDPSQLGAYDKLILPGVGAYASCMKNLNDLGFSDTIRLVAGQKGIPLLGICLGMQLLLESSSEHGSHKGLGLVEGAVEFLGEEAGTNLKVPHIGWNEVEIQGTSKLLRNMGTAQPSFYFLHSYFCNLKNKGFVTGTTKYGRAFDVVFESGNIFGCQFHPEKSQQMGLTLLKNFADL